MLNPTDVEQAVYREFARAGRKEFFGRVGRRLLARLRCDGAGGDVAGRLACFGGVRGSGCAQEVLPKFETVGVEKISGSCREMSGLRSWLLADVLVPGRQVEGRGSGAPGGKIAATGGAVQAR